MAPRNRHTKVQRLEDQDGWTHVIRGPRLPSTELNRTGTKADRKKLSLQKASSSLSIAEIRIKYRKVQERWSIDPLRTRFEEQFTTQISASQEVFLDNAVVLGLGSLAADKLDATSMQQLVLFEHWLAFLRTRYEIPTVYFQDPSFHANDKVFLEELGYTVVTNHEAYLLLTSTTFLYAPYLPWSVLYSFYYVAYPAVLVCNESYSSEDILMPARSEILSYPVVEKFYASRSSISLMAKQGRASDNRSQWLQDIFLYWPAEHIQGERLLNPDSSVLPSTMKPKRARPLELPERQREDIEDFPSRVGPGEWHRGEGFVFDADFEERLRGTPSRKSRSP